MPSGWKPLKPNVAKPSDDRQTAEKDAKENTVIEELHPDTIAAS